MKASVKAMRLKRAIRGLQDAEYILPPQKMRQRLTARLEDGFFVINAEMPTSQQDCCGVCHCVPSAKRLVEMWRKQRFKKGVR